MARLLSCLALAVTGIGCAAIECGDDDLVYGVELVITEPGGPYSEPIAIRWRVDEGPWFEVPDSENIDPGADLECPLRGRCLLGFDRPGHYEVEVRRDRASVSIETWVRDDYCSVETVTVPVELPAT